MDKRSFVESVVGLSLLAGIRPAYGRCEPGAGPALLTISGRLSNPNRGRMDEALDQLMHKHSVMFEQARTFSHADLSALPATTIRPTLEYDARPHALRGPTLMQLLEVAGAARGDGQAIGLRAIDGYVVEMRVADVRRLNFLVATTIDGVALPLGGLGPLWAVCDADRIAELSARPLAERFAQCPWGLYSVHLR